jgi:hypothetical protein
VQANAPLKREENTSKWPPPPDTAIAGDENSFFVDAQALPHPPTEIPYHSLPGEL